MTTAKTVFIVGAGGSVPYGFPSGSALLSELKHEAYTESDYPYNSLETDHLKRMCGAFRQELRKSGAPSIDDFLHDRSDLLKIGKQCLARQLIGKEIEDNLFDSPGGGHWLAYLWGIIKNNPDKHNISFITYNYDRTIEHFLTTATASTRNLTPEQAWDDVQHFSIIHPHGMLGSYRPSDVDSCDSGRRFNHVQTTHEIRLATNDLHLYWESPDQRVHIQEQMENVLLGAEQVAFVGFGFLESNWEHLAPMLPLFRGVQRRVPIYGSALGLPRVRAKQLKYHINDIQLHECDALDLLRNYVDVLGRQKPIKRRLANPEIAINKMELSSTTDEE